MQVSLWNQVNEVQPVLRPFPEQHKHHLDLKRELRLHIWACKLHYFPDKLQIEEHLTFGETK